MRRSNEFIYVLLSCLGIYWQSQSFPTIYRLKRKEKWDFCAHSRFFYGYPQDRNLSKAGGRLNSCMCNFRVWKVIDRHNHESRFYQLKRKKKWDFRDAVSTYMSSPTACRKTRDVSDYYGSSKILPKPQYCQWKRKKMWDFCDAVSTYMLLPTACRKTRDISDYNVSQK